MKKTILIFLFLFSVVNISKAQKLAIAVLDVNPQGVDNPTAAIISEIIRGEFRNNSNFVMIEKNRMQDILKEQAFQLSGCTESKCAVKAGTILNVDKIIVGSIGKIGQKYVLTLRVVDVKTANIECQDDERQLLITEDELDKLVPPLVGRLIPKIKVTGNPASTPKLISPLNGATGVPPNPTFVWSASRRAKSYRLEIARDSLFNILLAQIENFTSASITMDFKLSDNATFYWRVMANGIYDNSDWSEVRHFTVHNKSEVSEDGLLSYYPFNGDARDEGANTKNATVKGATLTEDRYGNKKNAYYFNGKDDYIECNKIFNSEIFTISLWVKTEKITTQRLDILNIFSNERKIQADNICLYLNDYKTGFDINGNNCNPGESYIVGNKKWHFIAIVSYSNKIEFFVDGYLANVSPKSAGLHGNTLYIGKSIKSDSRKSYWNGYLDDIRIYKRALMMPEIEKLYKDSYSSGKKL